MDRLYILYDAHCGLCSWAKRWLMRQSMLIDLRFIPAGSATALRLFPGLDRAGEPPDELVVVSDQGAVYRNGSAWIMCLFCARSLSGLGQPAGTSAFAASGPTGFRPAIKTAVAGLALALSGERGRNRGNLGPGQCARLCVTSSLAAGKFPVACKGNAIHPTAARRQRRNVAGRGWRATD